MAYSTINDVLKMLSEADLIELTEDVNATAYDPLVVDRAITDADAEIDGYVGARYKVSRAPVPPVLRKYSVDMAIYNLYSRRQIVNAAWRKRYEDAISYLTLVAQGKISLGAGDAEPGAVNHAPSIQGPERIFSRRSLKGY